MDAAQTVLIIVVVVLTFLLLVLGIQIFFILRSFRKTIEKANKVLDDTGSITESVSGPLETLSTIVSGVQAGASFAKLFKTKKNFIKRLIGEDEEDDKQE